MSILRFYDHFAAAYGTCWLVLAFPAFFGGTFHIGKFGFYAFFIISLGCAVIRMVNDTINRLHAAQDFSELD